MQGHACERHLSDKGAALGACLDIEVVGLALGALQDDTAFRQYTCILANCVNASQLCACREGIVSDLIHKDAFL